MTSYMGHPNSCHSWSETLLTLDLFDRRKRFARYADVLREGKRIGNIIRIAESNLERECLRGRVDQHIAHQHAVEPRGIAMVVVLSKPRLPTLLINLRDAVDELPPNRLDRHWRIDHLVLSPDGS